MLPSVVTLDWPAELNCVRTGWSSKGPWRLFLPPGRTWYQLPLLTCLQPERRESGFSHPGKCHHQQ